MPSGRAQAATRWWAMLPPSRRPLFSTTAWPMFPASFWRDQRAARGVGRAAGREAHDQRHRLAGGKSCGPAQARRLQRCGGLNSVSSQGSWPFFKSNMALGQTGRAPAAITVL